MRVFHEHSRRLARIQRPESATCTNPAIKAITVGDFRVFPELDESIRPSFVTCVFGRRLLRLWSASSAIGLVQYLIGWRRPRFETSTNQSTDVVTGRC